MTIHATTSRGEITMKNAAKFVAYYRVSSKKQGRSGLGLDAQRDAAAGHAARDGGRIVREFTEVESGTGRKLRKRHELLAAIEFCRAAKATLLVAKLDRLARDVLFTATLMRSGVPFVCCDNPTATPLTIHILAAVAEDEARVIAQRTRDSLAAAKKRGVKLGSHRRGHWSGTVAATGETRLEARERGAAAGNEESAAVRHEAAARHHAAVIGEAARLRAAGSSWASVATALNDAGFTTRRGNQWNAARIHEVMKGFGPELLGRAAPLAALAMPLLAG
jgi:DNA invertase Pin-like site-specific DNA recombinase